MRHRKLDAPYRLFETSCGPSFSAHGYPTQCAVNTSGPRSDRFWLRELRVSQQISTFYGPSVQAMDTQLHALPTLPVLARTVSGYLNSAFLGLERNRSAVGKTKAPLPLHSIVTCRSRSGCHTLETLRRGKGLNGTQPAESIGNGGTTEVCRRAGVRQGAGERGRGRGDLAGEAGDAGREGESQLRDRSR